MPYIVIAVVAVLAVSVSVSANFSLKQIIGEVAGKIIGEKLVSSLEEETSFGGSVEIEDKTFEGGVTINGDLSAVKTLATIEIPMDFQQATSTAIDEDGMVLAKYRYTGDPVFCSLDADGVIVDISGYSLWTSSFVVGTTTCAVSGSSECGNGTQSFSNTGTATLIASTTLVTSTPDLYPFNGKDNVGSYTKNIFELTSDTWIVSNLTLGDFEGGTNTDALISSDYNSLDGTIYLNCFKQ